MPRTFDRRVRWGHFLPALLCSVLFYATAATSAEVEGLYSAEVDVPAQTDDARDTGIRAALAAVLLKLTGDRGLATRADVAPFLAQAGKIVQQYQFHELPAQQEGMAPPVRLSASFDGNAVMAFLQEAAIPVWGRSRPSVLLWAVIEEGGTRTVFDPALRPDAKTLLETRADQRGLPLVFPLWDLDDQQALAPADVWGNFTETIQRASTRYRTNAVLVGRVFKRTGSAWTGRWTLYDTSGRFDWEVSAASANEVLAAGVEGTADNMTKRYAQVMTPGLSEQLNLVVTGVDSLARYGKVIQYLESLDAVSRVRVAGLEEMTLTLALQLRGSRDGLTHMIALGDVMVPQANSALPTPDGSSSLVYRMLP